MAITYEPITTTTTTSNVTSVTFSSVTSGFTDLVLVMNSKNTGGNDNYRLTLNNDTTSTNYFYMALYGSSTTSTGAYSNPAVPMYNGSMPSSDWSTNICNIMNYSNTTTYKSVLSRSVGTPNAEIWLNIWKSTAAISTIKIDAGANSLASGSTFTLYGIKGA